MGEGLQCFISAPLQIFRGEGLQWGKVCNITPALRCDAGQLEHRTRVMAHSKSRIF